MMIDVQQYGQNSLSQERITVNNDSEGRRITGAT